MLYNSYIVIIGFKAEEQTEECENKLKKKKFGKSKRKRLYNLIIKLITAAGVIVCAVSIIISYSNHEEMRKELDSINQKAEEIEAENIELERILGAEDMNAYMEKLAIEKMNYAYPDEHRYYDKSRN